jgi:hypothetical protein
MWNDLKEQIMDKIFTELKSKKNWKMLKKHVSEKDIEHFVLTPMLSKINNHLNKYLMVFVSVNMMIMLLVVINILITIYYK